VSFIKEAYHQALPCPIKELIERAEIYISPPYISVQVLPL